MLFESCVKKYSYLVCIIPIIIVIIIINSLQALSVPNEQKLFLYLPDSPIQHHGYQDSQSGYEPAPESVDHYSDS